MVFGSLGELTKWFMVHGGSQPTSTNIRLVAQLSFADWAIRTGFLANLVPMI